MKAIGLIPLLSVLKLEGAVVVKRSEPLENCTVMTSDIELHGKSVTQILDAEEVQRRVRELTGHKLKTIAMKCIYCEDDPEVCKNCYCREMALPLNVTAEEVQRRARELTVTGQKIVDEQRFGRACREITIDVDALGEALNSAIRRHLEKPEHGGERKHHPQPRNPKSFRK